MREADRLAESKDPYSSRRERGRYAFSMKLLIAVHHFFDQWNAPAWFSERLRSNFPQLEVVHLPDYKRLDAEILDAEIAVAWSIRPEQIKAARKLRWIHSPAAAVHQLMFPELVASDIILTNAREVHGPVVAEHVIALIFALAKKIPGSVALQQKHVWGQQLLWDEIPRVREVAGATLGVVGLGAIGRSLVRSARALGMRVIAVREHTEKGSEGADTVLGPAQINEVFRQADYVVLAAPVTDSTKAIANAERLALMQPSACLINVGRGPLVDELALASALREKKIGGAALDVFPKEPLAEDSPLWNLPNLLITPHTGALTDKLWERHYALFSENLRRYLAGQELLAVVDKRKGY
jgi:phosphoglycerate dehydrogenase-like enzyme